MLATVDGAVPAVRRPLALALRPSKAIVVGVPRSVSTVLCDDDEYNCCRRCRRRCFPSHRCKHNISLCFGSSPVTHLTDTLCPRNPSQALGLCIQNSECTCVNEQCHDNDGINYGSACTSSTNCWCDTNTGKEMVCLGFSCQCILVLVLLSTHLINIPSNNVQRGRQSLSLLKEPSC